MTVYSHNYVTIADVCGHNDLDYNEVMDAICNSDISFGTNWDTLISQAHLQSILDDHDFFVTLDFGGHDETVVISLGS